MYLIVFMVLIAVECTACVACKHTISSHLLNRIDTVEYSSPPCFIDDHPVVYCEAVGTCDTNSEEYRYC